jgi:hypothetical protein
MKSISALFVVVAILASAGAWGEYFTDDKETMRGLPGVKVIVESLRENATKAGLKKERIKTTVELELRKAGIKVLSEEEWANTEGFPSIYIHIDTALRENDSLVNYTVSIELNQTVVLARDASKECLAITWATRTWGGCGTENIDWIRTRALVSQLEKFINDWLTVNPKK